MGNDLAWQLAERIMEYNYEKRKDKFMRQYHYLLHKKEMWRRRKIVWILSLFVSIVLILCTTIITMELQLKEREQRVASLQAEVLELRKENQEAEKRLTQRNDFAWVMEEAIKLGMSRATADRVIYYSVDKIDYMEQYESIPIG